VADEKQKISRDGGEIGAMHDEKVSKSHVLPKKVLCFFL